MNAAASGFRNAGAADSGRIARLHAESWRVAYRGILADDYLDGPVFADRESLWFARFIEGHDAPMHVVVMEDEAGELLGFGCLRPEVDPAYGVLVDNLHVRPDARRAGLGTRLIAEVARHAIARHPGAGLHLWVLEANRVGRGFYSRRGGEEVELQSHLMPDGSQYPCLRVVWRDPRVLLSSDRGD